jgi:hypothetical protein
LQPPVSPRSPATATQALRDMTEKTSRRRRGRGVA